MSLINAASDADSTTLAQGCLPSNNTLSDAVGPAINLFSGSLGGVLDEVVVFIVVALLVGVVIFAVSHKATGMIRGIAIALGAPIGGAIAVMIYNALFAGVNSLCT